MFRFPTRSPLIMQAPMDYGMAPPLGFIASVSSITHAIGCYSTNYLTSEHVKRDIQEIKKLTNAPFSVNICVPDLTHKIEESAKYAKYIDAISRFRQTLNIAYDFVQKNVDLLDETEKIINIVIEQNVSVVTFTFGILPDEYLARLKANNIYVMGTATSVQEAVVLDSHPHIDAVIIQGSEAGGHHYSFLTPDAAVPTLKLVSQVVAQIKKAVIAAGGIMDGYDMRNAIRAGASGVQIGTAFLSTHEYGLSEKIKEYLFNLKRSEGEEEDPTIVTSVFTGKKARAIRNAFVTGMEHIDTPPYPIAHILSASLRAYALRHDCIDYMSIWCDQNVKKMPEPSSVEVLIKKIFREYDEISPSELKTNDTLLSTHSNKYTCLHKSVKCCIALTNGVLYYSVAVEGGRNIEKLIPLNETAIKVISVGSSIVYSMFMYKTLESLTIKPKSVAAAVFVLLAPFSAIALLTAGANGTSYLGFPPAASYAIGVILFLMRALNCIDASVKFPERMKYTQSAFRQALKQRDIADLARLLIAWSASIGYVLCTTDATYQAVQIIFSWFGVNSESSHPIGMTVGVLGAFGTLPLNVYWSIIGLRQLTNGGKPDDNGTTPAPTDRYTFIGLVCVLPVMLGSVGSATASSAKMFGRCGETAIVMRIVTSIMFAIFAGTPGMAALLRGFVTILRKQKSEEKLPILSTSRFTMYSSSEVNKEINDESERLLCSSADQSLNV